MTGATFIPRHIVIDDLLPREVAAALLAHALANEARFRPGEVRSGAGKTIDRSVRAALVLDGGVRDVRGPLIDAVTARFDALCSGVGMAPFAIDRIETTMAAYRDGDRYARHIDTRTQPTDPAPDSIRLLSCVYYLHTEPAGFSGGALMLHPLVGPGGSDGAPYAIAPRHNRLVAFPSFVPHEVAETRVAGNRFADARFAINCWLHRTR